MKNKSPFTRDSMKFDYSHSEYTTFNKQGKKEIKTMCSVCYKKHKNNYGFFVKLTMSDHCGARKTPYCHKCAKKFIPMLFDALENIRKEEEKKKQSVPDHVKKEIEDEHEKFIQDLLYDMYEEEDKQ